MKTIDSSLRQDWLANFRGDLLACFVVALALLSGIFFVHKGVLKLKREGTEVEVVGLNEARTTVMERFSTHGKPGVVEPLVH